MPILVPASTWHVPDGYVTDSAKPWEGNLTEGDLLEFGWNSSQAAAGSTSPDFDIGVGNLATGVGVSVVSPAWGSGSGSATYLIPTTDPYVIFLEVGGGHSGDPGGTLFGFSAGVTYATPGFNAPDAALTLQLGNTLAPFGWSVSSIFNGWTGNGALELEEGVTAIAWTITTLPGGIGNSGGDPLYYYTNGFATPISPYGAERSTRVSFSPQLMRLPSACREVRFFLPLGLVLAITQLVPSSGNAPA